MAHRRAKVAGALGAAFLFIAAWAYNQLPAIAAGGLLHPARHRVTDSPPAGCVDAAVVNGGLKLTGWRCAACAERRGTVVYLHGIADNRTSAKGVIDRFRRRGFDVVAFDSRDHGNSDGDVCTYGYFEKADLRRIIDIAATGPIVLIGTSLGAAVALQEAADDPRVSAVVAAEAFSDLRTVAEERAPWILSRRVVDRAFRIAERDGRFSVAEVSPRAAARRIRVPVLLVHGALDHNTVPAHSERIFAELHGPKRLLLVPGAHHNESLNSGATWAAIEEWIDQALARR